MGMALQDLEGGDVVVNQTGYIDEVVESAKVTTTASMPASGTFACNPAAPLCDVDEFRSLLMKVMYLDLRTRPGI